MFPAMAMLSRRSKQNLYVFTEETGTYTYTAESVRLISSYMSEEQS